MEEYRKIKGFENYSVSNLGNVRNDITGRIFKTCLDKYGYKRITINHKTFKVHRLVAKEFIPNPENRNCIDHIDNIRTNNNITNLRWVTSQQNSSNRSISNINESGHKGVSWNKKDKKWKAHIKHNYKSYHLGCFINKEDAIKARQKKANELFGDFVNKCEKIVTLNINIPPNTKLNININVEDDPEELRLLEEEFLEAIK